MSRIWQRLRPREITAHIIYYKSHRTGFECIVKRLRMVLYKPGCDFNDCELPSGQATPSSSSTILRHERHLLLSHFTLLAWFLNSSSSNAAVTAWSTSLRMFGNSCAWLDVGRFTFDLKYRWILISMTDSWTWLYRTVQMRTCVVHLSKKGEVTSNIIHCVFFFLRFFWLWGMEKLTNRNQKNLTIKTCPMVCLSPSTYV